MHIHRLKCSISDQAVYLDSTFRNEYACCYCFSDWQRTHTGGRRKGGGRRKREEGGGGGRRKWDLICLFFFMFAEIMMSCSNILSPTSHIGHVHPFITSVVIRSAYFSCLLRSWCHVSNTLSPTSHNVCAPRTGHIHAVYNPVPDADEVKPVDAWQDVKLAPLHILLNTNIALLTLILVLNTKKHERNLGCWFPFQLVGLLALSPLVPPRGHISKRLTLRETSHPWYCIGRFPSWERFHLHPASRWF